MRFLLPRRSCPPSFPRTPSLPVFRTPPPCCSVLTRIGFWGDAPTNARAELSSLLQVPLVAGTVNRGSDVIGGGVVANDWVCFTGLDTTATELAVMENIFKLHDSKPSGIVNEMRSALLDSLA